MSEFVIEGLSFEKNLTRKFTRMPSLGVLNMKTKKDDWFLKNSELSLGFRKYVLENSEMDEDMMGEKSFFCLNLSLNLKTSI